MSAGAPHARAHWSLRESTVGGCVLLVGGRCARGLDIRRARASAPRALSLSPLSHLPSALCELCVSARAWGACRTLAARPALSSLVVLLLFGLAALDNGKRGSQNRTETKRKPGETCGAVGEKAATRCMCVCGGGGRVYQLSAQTPFVRLLLC